MCAPAQGCLRGCLAAQPRLLTGWKVAVCRPLRQRGGRCRAARALSRLDVRAVRPDSAWSGLAVSAIEIVFVPRQSTALYRYACTQCPGKACCLWKDALLVLCQELKPDAACAASYKHWLHTFG